MNSKYHSQIWKILLFLVLCFTFGSNSSAEQTTNKEEIVLTTYYPVPYGDYREMRAERMAVGPNWRSHANVCWEGEGKCADTVTPPETSLIVEGNVGIGTANPGSKLSIMGGTSIGTDSAYYKGAAPEGGMIIQGNVGIGTSLPSNNLDVNGTMSIRGGNPAAGRVLVSDASGNASWSDISTGCSWFGYQQDHCFCPEGYVVRGVDIWGGTWHTLGCLCCRP